MENKKLLNLTKLARKNRKLLTPAEFKVWSFLRKRQMEYYFRRQHQIDNYIVDFVCLKKKLIIEIDGGQHNDIDGIERDNRRTEVLEQKGFKVIRFWNVDVLKNIEGVYEVILKNLEN
jgi:very-short-patch-repair endonuclease